MSIHERLEKDLKNAMYTKDAVRLRTIRLLRAALKDKEIAERGAGNTDGLTEEDVVGVLQKQAKQRRDAIEQYEQADRDDLAQVERDELALIETYLPEPMSDEDVRKILHEIIMATGAASPRDMGKVMGEAMKRTKGLADGRRVQALAKELLQGSEG